MSDIVERLRDGAPGCMTQGANEILRLRAENEKLRADKVLASTAMNEMQEQNEKLRAALKPIAELEVWDGYKDDNVVISTLTIRHIRAAAAVLKETGNGTLSEQKD